MKLFDSHCHLDDKSFKKDIDEVLKRSESADVYCAMIAGVTLESCKRGIALAESKDNFYLLWL